ncbi:hypothetical protein V1477_004023, partial [Vespula maculifrons]
MSYRGLAFICLKCRLYYAGNAYFAVESIGHSHTTGRVSRCLKPTVWTVERSVSGVLHISSLLRNLKLPKRKGISNADFRVESPLARGSPMQQPPRGGTWINYYSSSRVGPMSWAHGRGLLCGSLLSVSQNRALFSYSGFSRLL